MLLIYILIYPIVLASWNTEISSCGGTKGRNHYLQLGTWNSKSCTTIVYQHVVFKNCSDTLSFFISSATLDKYPNDYFGVYIQEQNHVVTTVLETLFEFKPVNDVPWIYVIKNVCSDLGLQKYLNKDSLKLVFKLQLNDNNRPTLLFIDNVKIY